MRARQATSAAAGARWRGGATAWWCWAAVVLGHLLSCARAGLLETNPGLAYNFYAQSCPSVDSVVRSITWQQVAGNPALAGKLLRLHFHDCFVNVSTHFSFPALISCFSRPFFLHSSCRPGGVRRSRGGRMASSRLGFTPSSRTVEYRISNCIDPQNQLDIRSSNRTRNPAASRTDLVRMHHADSGAG
jgi:hypothetical protein